MTNLQPSNSNKSRSVVEKFSAGKMKFVYNNAQEHAMDCDKLV